LMVIENRVKLDASPAATMSSRKVARGWQRV